MGCCCCPAAVSPAVVVSAAAFAMAGLLERLTGLCPLSLLTSFLPRVGGVGRDWVGNKGWKGGREITQ